MKKYLFGLLFGLLLIPLGGYSQSADAIALRTAIIAEEAANRGAGFSYNVAFDDLPAASVLIANQNADGSYADHVTVLPEPTLGNLSSQRDAGYEYENHIEYIRKVAVEWHETGNIAYFTSAMLALQGLADKVDPTQPGGSRWIMNKTSWTPGAAHGPRRLGYTLSLLANGWRSNRTTVYNGETADEILAKLLRFFSGVNSSFIPDFSGGQWQGVAEENHTGSADNSYGANAVQKFVPQINIGAAVLYATDSDSLLVHAVNILNTTFSRAWGSFYADKIDEFSEWIGFTSGYDYAMHNSPGSQSQTGRYFYTLINNMQSCFRVLSSTSSYTIDERNLEVIILTAQNIDYDLQRNRNLLTRSGRESMPVFFREIGAGPFAIRLEEIADAYTNWTVRQDSILRAAAYNAGGSNRLATGRIAKWYPSTGTKIVLGGQSPDTANYYSSWRIGRGAVTTGIDSFRVAGIEQSAAGSDQNFFHTGATMFATDWGQWGGSSDRNMAEISLLRSNWPQAGPDGTVTAVSSTSGIPAQASTPNAIFLNEEYGGVDMDSLYVSAGYRKQRLVFDVVDMYHFSGNWNILTNPTLSTDIGLQLDLYSGITTRSATPGGSDVLAHTVDYWVENVNAYLDGATNTPTILTPGSAAPDPMEVTNYAHWIPTRSGSVYDRGKGVVILGTHTYQWDNAGVRYKLSANFGSSPVDSQLARIRCFHCTEEDVLELRNNWQNYFTITNKDSVQGAIWTGAAGDTVAQYALYYEGQTVDLLPGRILTSDVPVNIIAKWVSADSVDISYASGRMHDYNAADTLWGASFTWGEMDHFREFWKDSIYVDRSGNGLNKPPGLYYWGESQYAGLSYSSTPPPAVPPSVLSTSITPTVDGFSISWTMSTAPVDSFYYLVDSGGVELFRVRQIPGTARSAVSSGNLQPGSSYRFRLRAFNQYGINGYENVPFTTLEAPPTDNTPPDVVTGLSESTTSGSVSISWTASASEDVAFYRVRLTTDAGATPVDSATNVTLTSVGFDGLSPTTAYQYQVFATDDSANESAGVSGSFTTDAAPVATDPPATPTGAAILAVDTTSVTITWNLQNDADVYTVRVIGGGVSVENRSGIVAPPAVFTGLVPDSAYTFWVRAVNAYGNAQISAIPFRTDTIPVPVVEPPQDTTPPPDPTAGLPGLDTANFTIMIFRNGQLYQRMYIPDIEYRMMEVVIRRALTDFPRPGMPVDLRNRQSTTVKKVQILTEKPVPNE